MREKLTSEDREEIREALREAAYHKAAMWDALGTIEAITGLEVPSDNSTVESLASNANIPVDLYPDCGDEFLDMFLNEISEDAA